MADRFGSEQSPPSPSVPVGAAALAQRRQGASSTGPAVDWPPGEVDGDARLAEEEWALIVFAGEEQARVKASMARLGPIFGRGIAWGQWSRWR